MSIARKPQKTSKKTSPDIESLINQGGSIAETNKSLVNEKPVSLRIPAGMLAELDNLLQKRTIRMPRHTWILEAVVEKIERETLDI